MSDGRDHLCLSTYLVRRRERSLVGDGRFVSNPLAPIGNGGMIDVQQLCRHKIELGADGAVVHSRPRLERLVLQALVGGGERREIGFSGVWERQRVQLGRTVAAT